MKRFEWDDDFPEDSFFRRYRFAIGGGILGLLVVGAAIAYALAHGKVPAPHKPEEIVVRLLPPPLPPPPPPPPPPPKVTPPEPKMVEQPKPKPDEIKPKVVKDDKPPGPPGPKASGPPSNDGIGGVGGGNGSGEIGGTGGSQFGWYANKVSAAVQQALETNSQTKFGKIDRHKVRIWTDNTGRVTRARLSGSTGDPALDAAINQALTGVIISEPPPSDMPMPIVLALNADRPR